MLLTFSKLLPGGGIMAGLFSSALIICSSDNAPFLFTGPASDNWDSEIAQMSVWGLILLSKLKTVCEMKK
jgi:hypothetical protein